jgi:membrane fusion protein (multidrug efflux system)
VFLICGVVVVLAGALFLWRHFSGYESTDDAQVDAHLHPISARIQGHVIRVNVADNEYVQQGKVLVEIDPTDYEVAVDQARADFENAVATARSLHINVPITTTTTSSDMQSTAANVEKSRAGVTAAEKQLEAAKARVDEVEATNIKAQHDVARYKMLVDKEEVSRQAYDAALATARANTATVDAARANLEAAEQSVKQAHSDLAAAEANHRAAQTAPSQVAATRERAASAAAVVKQKQAALEQAQLNLLYTKITAPVTGQVNKTVVVGMNVQAGQQLMSIVPLEEVWITANFKETQLRNIRPGQFSELSVDSNGRTYKGHVDSISGATGPLFSLFPPENATGNYVKIVQRVPVKIVLDPGQNNDLQLRPGVNVIAKVHFR